MQATMIGLDIAKWVFQVHGEDVQGRVVLQKRLARGRVLEFFAALPPTRIGIEACGSAHYWPAGSQDGELRLQSSSLVRSLNEEFAQGRAALARYVQERRSRSAS